MNRLEEPGVVGQAQPQAPAPARAGWLAGLLARLAAPRQFDLLRWFSILSFVTISAFAVSFASVMSHFLTKEVLQRDALLTSQFVASIAEVQGSQARLGTRATLGQLLDERSDLKALGIEPKDAETARLAFFDHLRFLPDVLLANVFAPDRRILWSTNPSLIGMVNDDNDELIEALNSRLMVANGYVGSEPIKEEQRFRGSAERFFVENYVPLFDAQGRVAAVVEIYKEPRSLIQTIRRGHLLVWACTAFGAVFLYIVLFWIIRRAQGIIRGQQKRLLESEALAVIGEMSAAVAHGIRNPLASIRSSAELALDGDAKSTQKNAHDIIAQVDRLGKWVRDLLVFSRPVSGESEPLELVPLIDDTLKHYTTQFERVGISPRFERPASEVPAVTGNRTLMGQVFASIIANAIEAMPAGGALTIELVPDVMHRRVDVTIADTGLGMSEAQLELVFKPFYTTKKSGLGLGLSLVRRIMERHGGAIDMQSRQNQGTRVTLTFAIA